MTARAPEAIRHLFDLIHGKIPQAVLSGIVGDAAHSYGYHLAPRDLPAGDYSYQLAADRSGPSDAASALDVSLPPELMKTVTARLVAAAKANDPRLRVLREFCGTLDGRSTYPWQLTPSNGSEGVGSWDDSHLWHVHLSILREYADNAAALAPVADVMAGVGAAPSKPAPSGGGTPIPSTVKLHRAWPGYMKPGNYFGLVSGPAASHGGYYSSERPDVLAIQARLQALGYAPNRPGWADGIYEKPTADAVAAWQRAKWAKYTTRYGEVWSDDWQRLFTY